MKATTDSDNKIFYDMENKPGISNLLNIVSLLTNKTIKEIEVMFSDKSYKEFKEFVSDEVIKFINDIQFKYEKLINSEELDDILDKGLEVSRKLAKEKYMIIKNKMGVFR